MLLRTHSGEAGGLTGSDRDLAGGRGVSAREWEAYGQASWDWTDSC